NPAQVLRLVLLEQSLEKVRDAPGGRRVLAAARGKRTRDEGEERAIDERVAVHEEQSRTSGRRDIGHGWCKGQAAISRAAPRCGQETPRTPAVHTSTMPPLAKRAEAVGTAGWLWCERLPSGARHVRSVKSLVAVLDLELHGLAFLKRLEAIHLDCGK